MKTLVSSHFINYVGQLRAYSYVDLILMFLWLEATPQMIVALSCLWFGFLVFLESIHKDRGRREWHWSVWVLLWSTGAILLMRWEVLFFFLMASLYAFKKKRNFGKISFITNGLIKVALVYLIPNVSLITLGVVFVAMSFRNLMGDFRDIEKDTEEEVQTFPIFLGFQKDRKYLYPVTLALTTFLWFFIGDLSVFWLIFAWVIQLITYNWTPR